MQPKMILKIPTPCNENWNNMEAPTQQQPGRFCSSCQKNVIDFTTMSDAQILAYFSAYQGNACGRFENGQLNRILITPPTPKKSWYKWIMAALVSGFMFSDKAKAQAKGKVGEEQICQTENKKRLDDTAKTQPHVLLGKVANLNVKQKYFLNGIVSDAAGYPLAGASVIIKGSRNGVATDKEGKFSLAYDMGKEHLVLQVSYVGYNPVSQQINLPEKASVSESGLSFELQPIVLDSEVIAGLVAVVRKTKKANKIVDSLRNAITNMAVLSKDKLTIAPNPAKAGSTISLGFAKAGEYELQLFNLQSVPLVSQKINIAIEGAKAAFNLPAALAAGEYFIRATNNTAKTQLAGKLIVQ